MPEKSSIQRIIKRAFDLAAAAVILIVLLPLILLISAAVWIFMGRPIIYTQPRLGYLGKPFTILKFRTMAEIQDEQGRRLPDEQRLTPLGKFLRNTTLDEIPELVNVLRGEMSVVGPRPLLVDYRDLYTEEQARRHLVRPGMAGPVLASGRNALTWEEKFRLDVSYVDRWSLGLDFKILLQSLIMVLKREGVSAEGHATMPRFMGSKNQSGDSVEGE